MAKDGWDAGSVQSKEKGGEGKGLASSLTIGGGETV